MAWSEAGWLGTADGTASPDDVVAGAGFCCGGVCIAFPSFSALLSKALPSAFPRAEPVLAAALPAAELPIAASAVACATAWDENGRIKRAEASRTRRDMNKPPPHDKGSVLPILAGVNGRTTAKRKAGRLAPALGKPLVVGNGSWDRFRGVHIC